MQKRRRKLKEKKTENLDSCKMQRLWVAEEWNYYFDNDYDEWVVEGLGKCKVDCCLIPEIDFLRLRLFNSSSCSSSCSSVIDSTALDAPRGQ